jgi:hypothetical protein
VKGIIAVLSAAAVVLSSCTVAGHDDPSTPPSAQAIECIESDEATHRLTRSVPFNIYPEQGSASRGELAEGGWIIEQPRGRAPGWLNVVCRLTSNQEKLGYVPKNSTKEV